MNVAQLSRVMPRAPTAWLNALEAQLPGSSIDTPHELASFLAQIAHESAELTRLEENLSYSAARLVEVWPRHFPTLAAALPYEHNPEKLANFVYDDANRSPKAKLGNIHPGDGWKYIGRGPIGITGYLSYLACERGTGEPLTREPRLLLVPHIGIRSALWYWQLKKLDLLDDDDDIRPETLRINGGLTGLESRRTYFEKALTLLTSNEVA